MSATRNWGGALALALLVGCGDDDGGATQGGSSTTESSGTTTAGSTSAGESGSTTDAGGGLLERIDAYFAAIDGTSQAMCACYVKAGSTDLESCLAGREAEYPAALRDCHRAAYLAHPSAELEAWLECNTTYEGSFAACLAGAECSDGDASLMACTDEVGLPPCGPPPPAVLEETGMCI